MTKNDVQCVRMCVCRVERVYFLLLVTIKVRKSLSMQMHIRDIGNTHGSYFFLVGLVSIDEKTLCNYRFILKDCIKTFR